MKKLHILYLISLEVTVWKRHADTWSWFSGHAHLPCRKKKVFYLNNNHKNGMITVTSPLKMCKSYILHMSVLLMYRQILHCFNVHYILKLTSNCFSHYHKYSKTVTWERLDELSHDMFMSESMLLWNRRVLQILLLGSLNTS